MSDDSKNLALFGNEIEIDGIMYVSIDFLRQYPEYLDNELERQTSAANGDVSEPAEDEHAERETDDEVDGFSTHKSELTINGITYIAVPLLPHNPNYIELKYNQKADVSLPVFVPLSCFGGELEAAAWRRRRFVSIRRRRFGPPPPPPPVSPPPPPSPPIPPPICD